MSSNNKEELLRKIEELKAEVQKMDDKSSESSESVVYILVKVSDKSRLNTPRRARQIRRIMMENDPEHSSVILSKSGAYNTLQQYKKGENLFTEVMGMNKARRLW